uniref:Uncharacterized protein n=1 Tax=Anguilla anguilla TaxID=7936 RepID=A0A0E9WE44_ANGAN
MPLKVSRNTAAIRALKRYDQVIFRQCLNPRYDTTYFFSSLLCDLIRINYPCATEMNSTTICF